jgi:hypothetical protein
VGRQGAVVAGRGRLLGVGSSRLHVVRGPAGEARGLPGVR